MTQTRSLSEVIRQVGDHVTPKPGYEELVVINARTGQAVSSPKWLETVTGDFRYFLVANNQDPQKTISGTRLVKYKEGNGEIVFAIDYGGGCRAGREGALAQFYFKANEAEEAMRDALARWLIEYFSSAGRTLDQFYAEQKLATLDLVTKAGQEFGLELTITLRVEIEKQPETLEVGPLMISSRLNGCDEEENIWFKAELEVDPQRLLRALLNQNKSFTELLKKGVRKYLAESVTLHAFYDDLNSERIKQGLRAQLNQLLKPVGRQVTFLSLKPDVVGGHGAAPQPFNGDTIIEYRHYEYPDPIKIKISVLMIPSDAQRYRSKGSPALAEWLERNLREVINLVLFGTAYVDLLLNFANLKIRIGDLMNRRSEDIGYKIEQLMTMLYMEPFIWLRRIDVEIKDDSAKGELSDAMFETSLQKFYVGLEVFLTAKVRDLRGIERYLVTKDVPQKMREEIIRLVGKTMHATDPERFYMRYSEIEKEKYPNEKPFEVELREKIELLINSEFNADVIQLVLKQTETDLTRKLGLVSKASHDFQAVAEFGSLPGAPAIVVQGSFKVEAVYADGWRAFQEHDVSVQAIRKRIEDSIRAHLKLAPDDHEILAEGNGLLRLIDQCLAAARNLIQDEFGLTIKFSTVSWDWDASLKKLGRQQSEEEIASIQGRVAKLKEELLDQYQHNGNPEDIAEIEAAIRRLNSALSPALAASVGIRALPEPSAVKALPTHDVDTVQS